MEIGRTDISKEQLKLLVNEMKPEYPQNSYDLVAKCVSFAEFIQYVFLCVSGQ